MYNNCFVFLYWIYVCFILTCLMVNIFNFLRFYFSHCVFRVCQSSSCYKTVINVDNTALGGRLAYQSDVMHWSSFRFSRQCKRYSDSDREHRGMSRKQRWRTPMHDHSRSSIDTATPPSVSWPIGKDSAHGNTAHEMVHPERRPNAQPNDNVSN